MPAIAVTDRNNLFGALEFSQYAAKAGIQPIVGCDLGIRREEEGGIAAAGKAAAGRLADAAGAERGGLPQPDAAGEPGPSRVQGRGRSRRLPLGGAGRTTPTACWRWSAAPAAASAACWLAGQAAGRGPSARAAAGLVRRPPVYRAAAPRRGRRAAYRGAAARSRLCPPACRWSRPTTCISRRPRCTRRTTCCSASSRARTSRIPTAVGSRRSIISSRRPRCARSSPTCRRPATTPW